MSTTADRPKVGAATPPGRASRRSEPPSPSDVAASSSQGVADRPGGRSRLVRKSAGAFLIIAAAAAAIFTIAAATRNWEATERHYDCWTATRTDLPIRLIERGNLEAQVALEIRCEVEDVSGDGIPGTEILWIVSNGAVVKKGDLLVQFDASHHNERLDDQILETEDERADDLQATALYENQITRNATSLAEAELKVKLAELALRSFEDEDGGTYQIALEDIQMQIQAAEAAKLLQDDNVHGMRILGDLGYASRREVTEAELKSLSANRSLAKVKAERRMQIVYNHAMEKLRLEVALETARRRLIQTRRDNESELAQALARKHSADRSLARDEERLLRCREQVEKCMVYAPQDGMVVYGYGIRVGEACYPRRLILRLPDLSEMQVRATIHESRVNQVKAGMPATVRVDARPNETYQGTVQFVGVLPQQSGWLDTGTKVYETIVTIDQSVDGLRPGMTAVAEVHVEHLTDVLAAPVGAVVRIAGLDWCYVLDAGRVERRRVTLGKTNEESVEICDGLQAGDRVILDPREFEEVAQSGPTTLSSDAEFDADLF